MAGCARHLLGGGGGGSGDGGRPAQALILVGYSMGGVVARAALRLLSQLPDAGGCRLVRVTLAPAPPPSRYHNLSLTKRLPLPMIRAEPGRVALLLTLGSPAHHFPHLMPPPPPPAPDPGLGPRPAAFLAATPTLDVTSGPRDGLVPAVGPAALPHPAALAAPGLALAMGEVPGVWTAAGHKVLLDTAGGNASQIAACLSVCWTPDCASSRRPHQLRRLFAAVPALTRRFFLLRRASSPATSWSGGRCPCWRMWRN